MTKTLVSNIPMVISAKLLSFENKWQLSPDRWVAAFLEDACGYPLQKFPHFSRLVSAGGFSSDEMLFVAAHGSLRSEGVHQSTLNGVDTVEELGVDAVQELCLIGVHS